MNRQLIHTCLQNYAHLNQQARENAAYLNEQLRTQHLKNIGAIPKEPIATPALGAPATSAAATGTPAAANAAANADWLGLQDIAQKQREYVANENRLNQKFISGEVANNQAVAQGQLPPAVGASPNEQMAADEGAFKKA